MLTKTKKKKEEVTIKCLNIPRICLRWKNIRNGVLSTKNQVSEQQIYEE